MIACCNSETGVTIASYRKQEKKKTMIESIYKKEILTAPSLCDYSGRLSIPDVFALLMDLATEHADNLNIGLKVLSKQDLYWIAVKTKVHIAERPSMGETITAETWPEKPKGVRCVRDYTLAKDGKIFVTAKTEWAVMNMKTGQIQRADNIYPPELVINEAKVMPEAFARFDNEPFDEIIGEYIVRSVDIDIGRHMNNTAYLRAFFGLLSIEQRRQACISDIEVYYKSQCYEGDRLTFMKKTKDDKTIVQAFLPDGRAAIQIVLS